MHDSAMAHIVKALVTVMDCDFLISSFEFLQSFLVGTLEDRVDVSLH